MAAGGGRRAAGGGRRAAGGVEITAKDLQGSGPKTEFLQFRVSKSEKESIQNTAAKLGIQVSEYILKLHELVAEKVNKD